MIFFFIFLQSPHQVDMKNVVKCWKDFLSYFTTLKTYCGLTWPKVQQKVSFAIAMSHVEEKKQ